MVVCRYDHDAEEIRVDAYGDETTNNSTSSNITDGISTYTNSDMRVGLRESGGVQLIGEIHATKIWQKYLTDDEVSTEWCFAKGQKVA
jgi:hypothetical protein